MKFFKNTNASSNVLNKFVYSYNTANQITQITEPSKTRTFGYDNADRLTTSTSTLPNQNESYTFDDVGNRTSSHLSSVYGYQSGSFNRLSSTQQASYSFDNNGNLTSKSDSNSKWYYSYDRENRLTNAAKFGGLMPRANESVNYQYDALGRRVVRQDKKTGRTEFTHDGMDVIQDRFEKNDGTLSTTNYINGIGIDDKLKLTTGTTSKYFLTDHLGSTTALTDTNGNVTESASYDSFGRIQSSNLMTRYQYTGRETDETTGLMYYRARQYDPQIGRFTSEDPIGFEGGDINLYLYVKNQPVKLKDPSGLISPDEQMLYENEIKSMSEEREHWIKQQHILLERPCDCVERDARGYDKNALLISKFLSGDSNDPYVVGGNHPGGLNIKPNGQSYHDVVTKAYSMGFTQLPNFDSTHWGGTDYKIQMPSGQWYHITIGRPKGDWAGWTPSQPTPWITIHCHGSDPSGFAHINDWLRLKTNGVWPF